MHFKTRFLNKISRTPSAISYRFTPPDGLNFSAGQYMLVDLGNELVHPLSLSDCPEEKEYIEFTKRITGSPYCERLESLVKGAEITVKGPFGRFVCDDCDKAIVMIAGGIGITPIRSILKSQAMGGGTPGKITLLYGNQDLADIAFKDELENLDLTDYRLIHVLQDNTDLEEAYQGYINETIISKEAPEYLQATTMISGPPMMVDSIKKSLATLKVPKEQIRTDTFLGYE